MDAVLLACASAALFGAMTVALRNALAAGHDADAGALLTILPALAVTRAVRGLRPASTLHEVWPFLLAGPARARDSRSCFFTSRSATPGRRGPRSSVGTAPLFSVAIALVLLDEPLQAGLVAGALLIVGGRRAARRASAAAPATCRSSASSSRSRATIVFAARDNLVRWLAGRHRRRAAARRGRHARRGRARGRSLRGSAARRRLPVARCRRSSLPVCCFGLSYVCLFEAYYRGRVSVVSPLVATESLWGVALSALLLRRHELVGPRLFAGAALVVAGGALIGVAR